MSVLKKFDDFVFNKFEMPNLNRESKELVKEARSIISNENIDVQKLLEFSTVRNLSTLNILKEVALEVNYAGKILSILEKIRNSMMYEIENQKQFVESLKNEKINLRAELEQDGENRIQVNKGISPVNRKLKEEEESLKTLQNTHSKISKTIGVFYSFRNFSTEEGKIELLQNIKKAKSSKHNRMTKTIEAFGLNGLSHEEKIIFYAVLGKIKKIELIPSNILQDELIKNIVTATKKIEIGVDKLREDMLKDVDYATISDEQKENLNNKFLSKQDELFDETVERYFGSLIKSINEAEEQKKREAEAKKTEESLNFEFDSLVDEINFTKLMTNQFKTLIKVADTNNPKVELNGVLLDLENGKIVATDTIRLSIIDIEGYTRKSTEPFILKREDIKKLKDISKIEVGYKAGAKVARVTHSKGEDTVGVIDNKYPDYNRIIPSEPRATITLDMSKEITSPRLLKFVGAKDLSEYESYTYHKLRGLRKVTNAEVLLSFEAERVKIEHYVGDKRIDGFSLAYNVLFGDFSEKHGDDYNKDDYDKDKYDKDLVNFVKDNFIGDANSLRHKDNILLGSLKANNIPSKIKGERLLLNYKFFKDAIENAREAKLYFNESTLPFVIEANGIKTVIMPIISDATMDSINYNVSLDSIQVIPLETLKDLKSSEPTENQKESGNYKKHKIKLKNKLITIENIAGSIRSNVDSDGKRWTSKMKDHYGYFNGTLGADGDHVDVFVNSEKTDQEIETLKVYAVVQNDIITHEFDEHKLVLGATSEDHAKEIYLRNYSKDFKGFGDVLLIDDLGVWLEDETIKNKGESK